jgi:hypothetical protein
MLHAPCYNSVVCNNIAKNVYLVITLLISFPRYKCKYLKEYYSKSLKRLCLDTF